MAKICTGGSALVAIALLSACESGGPARGVPPLQDKLAGTKFTITKYSDVIACEGKPDQNVGPNRVGRTLKFTNEPNKEGTAFKGELSSGTASVSFDWKVVPRQTAAGTQYIIEIRNSPFNCLEWEVDHFRPFHGRPKQELEIVCKHTLESGCVETITITADLEK